MGRNLFLSVKYSHHVLFRDSVSPSPMVSHRTQSDLEFNAPVLRDSRPTRDLSEVDNESE